jgi:hypothetical protein
MPLANVRCKQRKDFFALFTRRFFMGSIFSIALCLIAAFTMVSCSSNARTVAQEQEVKRAPDYRNKEVNRQYVRGEH